MAMTERLQRKSAYDAAAHIVLAEQLGAELMNP